MITLRREFCPIVNNTDDLKNNVFPDLQINIGNREWLCERAILAPTNDTVGPINEQIISDVEWTWMLSSLLVDNVMDTEQVTSYPIGLLNSRIIRSTIPQV
ncbi:unnamed protein product [Euphydryas editha]|uniref:ATP-dependent DNA helicase n=1 Tax=Euphydryas editha TaxID=104508 RepID=A0AAU9TCV6_EUPED|nr:unnamed protein product [Euphydryas editha]